MSYDVFKGMAFLCAKIHNVRNGKERWKRILIFDFLFNTFVLLIVHTDFVTTMVKPVPVPFDFYFHLTIYYSNDFCSSSFN